MYLLYKLFWEINHCVRFFHFFGGCFAYPCQIWRMSRPELASSQDDFQLSILYCQVLQRFLRHFKGQRLIFVSGYEEKT